MKWSLLKIIMFEDSWDSPFIRNYEKNQQLDVDLKY